jgi:hypothetical protein
MTPPIIAALILAASTVFFGVLAATQYHHRHRLEMELEETRTTLYLFREFHLFYVVKEKIGASHHHPIWARVSAALTNFRTGMSREEYEYITGPYWRYVDAPNRAKNKDTNN